MKKLLLLLPGIFLLTNTYAYQVSGTASNSETGEPLPGFDILITYIGGGIAGSATTGPDGSFVITDIPDGTYGLEFYTYPDPIILNGDYFMRTIYNDQITVSGGNVSGIDFSIPPHHPVYTLTGVLYDDVTKDTITIQNFQIQAKMQYLVKFFYDFETENGTYIIEDLPDWTYEFNLFENDYYEGITTEITIDTMSPDTIHMDFYLQPKMGATVSGVLLDSTTNQPIMQAGRSIQLEAPNSFFTETNDQGEFTFINIPPGVYGGINVTSQDTDYVNCVGSELGGITVPEEGVDSVVLYQKPWISLHEITADDYSFIPGETKTVKFSIVNDDLSYGSIWGVNLIFPEGVTVLNTEPFYSADNSDVIFDQLPECSSNVIKAWEGWHFVGIPPYASSDGNLDELNESAWSDVTLQFADSATMETAPVFYEIFYDIHCFTIQPFSYGTIMMVNDNITGNEEHRAGNNSVMSYPNPATDRAKIMISLDKARKGKISIYNISGQSVMTLQPKVFKKGNSEIPLNTSNIENGIYYYTFLADDIRMTGRLVISR